MQIMMVSIIVITDGTTITTVEYSPALKKPKASRQIYLSQIIIIIIIIIMSIVEFQLFISR